MKLVMVLQEFLVTLSWTISGVSTHSKVRISYCLKAIVSKRRPNRFTSLANCSRSKSLHLRKVILRCFVLLLSPACLLAYSCSIRVVNQVFWTAIATSIIIVISYLVIFDVQI